MRVIIVDNDKMVVKFLETYLIKHGFKVVGSAYDGKNAMELAQKVEFDGIVIDYYLPDIIGTELAKNILKIRKNAKVVIITISEEVEENGYPLVRKKPDGFKKLIKELKSTLKKGK